MKVTGRVVVITGAGNGIGAALAREAANRGAAAIAVVDIEGAAAQRTAAAIDAYGVRAEAYQCDIADPAAVEELTLRVTSDLDVPGLVCANAGVSTDTRPLMQESIDQLNWVLSVNVVGTWNTLRAFGTSMLPADQPGWLLVTASEHALGVPYPGNGLYTMTKHAVLGMADVLRHELPAHVGISAMLPGLVATALSRSGRNRPARFGGAVAENDFARAILAQGMDPAVVACAALDGVDAERFLIATHVHARRYWQERSADIDDAFTVLDGSTIPDDSYDVAEVATRLLTDFSE